jgi:hypothetical protein
MIYKLASEHYEINEEDKTYLSEYSALEAAKAWEDFLYCSVKEAIESGILWVEEISLSQ